MRALVVSIALLGGVADAAAETRDAAALRHLDRGIELYRAGSYREAHAKFTQAHELAPDRANPYRWLALAEVQLGDCTAALRHIEGFLTRVKPDDERVPEMTRWRELCSRTGGLRVDTTPSEATLRLDGAVVGTTPHRSLAIRAGTHELVAEKSGYRTVTRSVVVTAGTELAVQLELEREGAAGAAGSPGITRRAWFWPVVGGAALLVAGGVVFVATRDGETVLPPVQCNAVGCRP